MKLTEFNEGGLHHQNPNGGIPVGGNNTVEQGETKIGNFVYSNRLFIDENLPKEMNLPNYIKNKSFADASKAIDNKFKDRNDKPSLETKKALLERLANAQEILKQQKEQEANKINEALKINSTQTLDMMNGQVPQGMKQFVQGQNQMFLGGLFGQNEMGNLTGGNQGIASAAGPGAAMGAMSLYGLSQGVGASPNKNATALNGVMQGAMTGSAFGPVGTAFGAIAGLGAGILGGNKAQREQARIAKNNAIMYNKGVSEDYAYGGKLEEGGYYDTNLPYFSLNRINQGPLQKSFPKPPLAGDFIEPTNTISQVGAGKPSDFLGYTIKPKNILPKPPTADMNTNIIQNFQDGLGMDPKTPGYGVNFGKLSNQLYFNDRIKRDPEYAALAKKKGLTTANLKNSDFTSDNISDAARKRFGLTLQGYKYLDPETPDMSMLKPQEQTFVEPTNVLQSMENYYKTSSNNINNGTITPKKDYSQVGNDLLRMSPVLSNMFQLKGMKAPKAVNYAPLRNTLQYDPIDEARQEKIINQEANKQLAAITQAGGSQGAFRNAITSVGLNSTLARNAAAISAEQQNREQRLKIQDNQQRVNEYNTNYLNKAIDERRMDLGNYDTQKSKFIGQIGSDLGEIGKEQTFKKQAEKITGYSWMGDFLNKNPNYKAQFDAIMKDPSLDDNTKRAKAKAFADNIYKGFNSEQINLANNSVSLVGSYGLPTEK